MYSIIILFYSGIGNITQSTINKFIALVSSLDRSQFDIQADIIQGKDNINSLGEVFRVITLKTSIKNKVISSILTEWIFILRLYHRISSLSPGNIIYIRYPPISKLTFFLIPLLYYSKHRDVFIIFEHNTKEIFECFHYNWRIAYRCILREKLLGKTLRRLAKGMICVTPEICEYETSLGYQNKSARIVIGNGVHTESIPMRITPECTTSEIRVLFSGHIQKWHGVDRFIRGMKRSNLNISLHIAGSGEEIIFLKELSRIYGLDDKIFFHGYVTGHEYDHLFNVCHIALGSLGIFRKNLKQTSELKVREYCARGIPFILGCDDPEFPIDFPYLLRVPNDETDVDMTIVQLFANRVLEDHSHSRYMRDFAHNTLDWNIKKEQYQKFFLEICCKYGS